MSTEHPDFRRGTRWKDIPARQWRNLADDVEGPATIQAGAGLIVNRVGKHFNLSVLPSILQLLTRKPPKPAPAGAGNVEYFQVMNERDRGDGPGIMQRDYFYAKRLSTGETRIKVAKPHKLQTSPWNGRTVYHTAFRTYVTYSNYTPVTGVRRRATRRDEPFVVELEFISPEYMTERDPDLTDTSEDIIKAAMFGEDATGIEGVDWEDMNDSGRVWAVLPAAFQA